MQNKQAKISFWFIIICLISILIWWKFKDIMTAALIFFGYVGLRILMNFLKRDRKENEYY
jgi:hypothetical protein